MKRYMKIKTHRYVYYVFENYTSYVFLSELQKQFLGNLRIRLAQMSDYIIDTDASSKIIKNRMQIDEEELIDSHVEIVGEIVVKTGEPEFVL